MSDTIKNGCGDCRDAQKQRECLLNLINRYKNKPGALISVLHQAQALYGYLPEEVVREISEGLRIPYTEVMGVVTFYHSFSTTPKGKYDIVVCMGTACYVRGSSKVLEKFEDELKVMAGGTTDDQLFSITPARCFGACGLAPAVDINGKVHQRVTAALVPGIIKDYREKHAAGDTGKTIVKEVVTNQLPQMPPRVIRTLDDLNKVKEEARQNVNMRLAPISPNEAGTYPVNIDRQLMLCVGSGCVSSGCEAVRDALIEEIRRAGIGDRNKVVQAGCIGCCSVGPIMMVYPEGIFYQHIPVKAVPDIVESHLKNGKPVTRLLRPKIGNKKEKVAQIKEIDYFTAQKQKVLSNSGLIDPSRIEDYIAMDGYQALHTALNAMSRDQVIAEVTRSGLRGRGGAGFSTGKKWEFAKNASGSPKYIICNADEGDPGAFMDRSALERDPHSTLEGMIICGYAVGSPQGYVYVRAEYPLAVERLEIALEQARADGLLGKDILGSGFDFDIEIRIGAGAFVCGEETALMNSIEGQRGEPRVRPPYPAVSGLWNCPTNINNVETFANVPCIIREGGEEYAKLGTAGSKGTKVFALAGDAVNSGLCEVPMGATLNEIVFDIGGGIIGGRRFKAAQLGGPSGGCVPARYGDTPLDYESLIELGAMMGSGGLVVMSEDTCMVDIARYFMDFVQDESCGKCPPCRVGTRRMLEILTRITQGEGKMEDIRLLQELSPGIKNVSLCGLGQTAPNPVLSTLRHFMDEYVAHCRDKQCPAGVCKPLFHFDINDNCNGCTLCSIKCPVKCISGNKKELHLIDQSQCTKCGMCYDACNFKAVGKVPGAAEFEVVEEVEIGL